MTPDVPQEDQDKETHLHYLKRLKQWLDRNPKNDPLVAKEAAAVGWALEQLGE